MRVGGGGWGRSRREGAQCDTTSVKDQFFKCIFFFNSIPRELLFSTSWQHSSGEAGEPATHVNANVCFVFFLLHFT